MVSKFGDEKMRLTRHRTSSAACLCKNTQWQVLQVNLTWEIPIISFSLQIEIIEVFGVLYTPNLSLYICLVFRYYRY